MTIRPEEDELSLVCDALWDRIEAARSPTGRPVLLVFTAGGLSAFQVDAIRRLAAIDNVTVVEETTLTEDQLDAARLRLDERRFRQLERAVWPEPNFPTFDVDEGRRRLGKGDRIRRKQQRGW